MINKDRLRIACDIDDCIADFLNAYFDKYGKPKKGDFEITKNVYKLKNNKKFWENLPVLERMDFEPCIYSTKRINSKRYTKNWLIKNNFPLKPIYQMYSQKGNKASMIKGRCDVLVDDSYSNVMKAIKSGLPALLLTRPHNSHILTPYRINSLKYAEIEKKYNDLFRSNT
jgi:uncharacterized HAD superfamily protein